MIYIQKNKFLISIVMAVLRDGFFCIYEEQYFLRGFSFFELPSPTVPFRHTSANSGSFPSPKDDRITL